MNQVNESEKVILEELENLAKTLVWYSPSQIEIGQHLSDDGSYGDRPWSVSKETGKFLYDFIIKNKLSTVVELGTSIGYSGTWIGLALKKLNTSGSKLYTVDKKEMKTEIAQKFFIKAGIKDYIESYNDDISTALPKIISSFQSGGADLIFFDANRSKYTEYLETLSPIISHQTILLVDNAIDMRERLESFHQTLLKGGWKIETLTIGDGLWLCKK
ncbi:MAG: class I SAM-dependent methyltransferase [bacterium]